MKITTDLTFALGVIMAISFVVNIATELTKEIVPVPTKLWCVLVATTVDMFLLFAAVFLGALSFNPGYIIISVIGSFVVAFIAMYGFDTFKELWQRFKKGEDINE